MALVLAAGAACAVADYADAVGDVVEWRVGLPPQVHYVEGCS